MHPWREITFADVPALGFAIAGVIGTGCALFVPCSASSALLISIGLVAAALVGLFFARRRTVAVVLTYAAICAVISFRGTSDLAREVRGSLVQHDPDTAIVTCRGVVIWRDEAHQSARSDRLWLEHVKLALLDTVIQSNHLRVRLSIPVLDASAIRIGDVIACNVRLEAAHLVGQRSVRELCWSLRERVIANARLVDPASLIVVKGGSSVRAAVIATRESIFNTLEKHLRPDARAVAEALLLGSRNAFSSEFREDLQLTGLAHLFALSGLNTGLLVSLCWLMMAWLRVPRRIRYVLLLLFLVFYTSLGLGVPSLFRSATMAGLMIISRLIARPSHPVNLLLFAAGLELLIWPLHILDAGFHLSYLSMAGILTAHVALKKPVQDFLRSQKQMFASRIADTLSSTIGAQLATAPAAALLFGRVPGLAIIANVIAIPLFSLLVVLILFVLLLDQFSFGAASAVARAVEGLVGIFALMTSGAASIAGASFSTKIPILLSVAAIVIQLVAIVFCLAGRVWTAMVVTLIALNLLIWPGQLTQIPDGRIATFGKVGNESVYLRAGEFSCMVGCGPDWLAERTSNELSELLVKDGLNKIDLLIIDSRVASKIGGAPSVIATGIPAFVIDFSEERDTHASAILDAALLQGEIEHLSGDAGMCWSKGASQLRIARADFSNGSNNWRIQVSDGDKVVITVQSTNESAILQRFDHGEAIISLVSPEEGCMEWICVDSKWRKKTETTEQLMALWNLPGRVRA